MCFSGGGGGSGSARSARNAQLGVQQRQVSTSSVTGFTKKAEWVTQSEGKKLVEIPQSTPFRQSIPRTPEVSYTGLNKLPNGRGAPAVTEKNFVDGQTTRTIASSDRPTIVQQNGKSYYEYKTTTQIYQSAGKAITSPDSLNRSGNLDPSSALRATRRARGAGVRITQGASTARAKRGGGLRIDTQGVNASSGNSGINIG